MTIATDDAVQMLMAGWQVEYCELKDYIKWKSPSGISCVDWHSSSLDRPPKDAVNEALYSGDIKTRLRRLI